MTARKVPLIFQPGEVPEARSTVLQPTRLDTSKAENALLEHGADSSSPDISSQTDEGRAEHPGSSKRLLPPGSVVGASAPRTVNDGQVALNKEQTSARRRLNLSPPPSAQLPMSFHDVRLAPERTQIGPRIHPSYKAFLEDLFHPIRHHSEGGIQTMLMACLEVVKRDPDLQKRAQLWASDGANDSSE